MKVITRFSRQSFRWLFAELLVVVVGILLAFQIEEFRTESDDRNREKSLLENFMRDLENDKQQFERLITSSESVAESLFEYKRHLQSGIPRNKEYLIELALKINTDSYVWVQSSPTYTGWRASARPDLISNADLRDLIFNYYDNYSVRMKLYFSRLEAAEEDFRRLTFYDWDSELIRNDITNELVVNAYPLEPLSEAPRHPEFYDSLDLYSRLSIVSVPGLKVGITRVDGLVSMILEHEKSL